jgi:hypothetical protein
MGSGIMDCGLVITDDDFAPSTDNERPETIQLEKPAVGFIENFRLSSAHVANPAIPSPKSRL